MTAGRLPEPLETALWYACAEALTNVVKHADASKAVVEVCVVDGEVVALVRDDGVGGARPVRAAGSPGWPTASASSAGASPWSRTPPAHAGVHPGAGAVRSPARLLVWPVALGVAVLIAGAALVSGDDLRRCVAGARGSREQRWSRCSSWRRRAYDRLRYAALSLGRDDLAGAPTGRLGSGR